MPRHEIIAQTNAYFEELNKYQYLEGVNKLEKLWITFMDLEED